MLSARLRQELTLRPHTSSSSQVQRACQEKWKSNSNPRWCPFFSTSLSLAGNSRRLNWVRHSNRKSYQFRSMCRVFPVSKQWDSCQCCNFWYAHKCRYMRLHTDAVRTPQESLHWKLTRGEKKNPLWHRGLERSYNRPAFMPCVQRSLPASCRVYRGLCQLHAVCTEASASFMPCVQRSLPASCRVYRGLCQLHAVCTEVFASFMPCVQRSLPASCRVYRGLCQLHALCTEASASFMSCAQRPLPASCRVHRGLWYLYVVFTEVSATFMSCLQKYLPPLCRVYRSICNLHVMFTEVSATFMSCVQKYLSPLCRVYRSICHLHVVCTEVSATFMSCVQKYLPPLCRVYRSICHLYVVFTEVSATFMSCLQKYLPPLCRVYRSICHLHVVCTEVSATFMSCVQKYLPPLCRVYRSICHLYVVFTQKYLPPSCRVYRSVCHLCLCYVVFTEVSATFMSCVQKRLPPSCGLQSLFFNCTSLSATLMSCVQPDFVVYSHCFSIARLSLPPSCNGVVRVCTDLTLTVQGGCLMGQSVLSSCWLFRVDAWWGSLLVPALNFTQAGKMLVVIKRRLQTCQGGLSYPHVRNSEHQLWRETTQWKRKTDRMQKNVGTELREILRDRAERDTEGKSWERYRGKELREIPRERVEREILRDRAERGTEGKSWERYRGKELREIPRERVERDTEGKSWERYRGKTGKREKCLGAEKGRQRDRENVCSCISIIVLNSLISLNMWKD